MGCICSIIGYQGASASNGITREKESTNSTVQLIAQAISYKEEPVKDLTGGRSSRSANGITVLPANRVTKPMIAGVPSRNPSRKTPVDIGGRSQQQQPQKLPSLSNVPRRGEAELTIAGWPSWLASVAGDAIKGWLPRSAESFEKLDKIGQGTYSSVYKARDLESKKIVAMKKVRFVNMDPESVRFMAREIHILRKLDHPNVMKLEGLVTSRLSGSLYLVFEYMEHDLAGLAANPGIKFTEPQIKCYMQQLFRGLQHCHRRGILHRDIKGSNLLINDDGVLKIGDFGLANFYHPDQDQPLTSRVVTLWYRAPELLLGASVYGVAIDLWSAGCILAELFAGKPIMPGRTEVEQMHKIFKLCGSPSEDYWQTAKLPLATSYKPHQPYKRVLTETFKNFPSSALALVDNLLTLEPGKRGSASSALRSEFFTSDPLPSDPSSLPKYSPSKELDVKLRNEEARTQKADVARRQGAETARRGQRDVNRVVTPEFIASGQSKISHRFKTDEEGGTGFRIEPPRRSVQNKGYAHATSMVHPSIACSSLNKGGGSTTQLDGDFKSRRSQAAVSGSSQRMGGDKDSAVIDMPKKNRIHYSGPLMPPGGNIEDMLKEHDRQIRHAVRRSRVEKSTTMKSQQIYIGRYAR